MEDYSDIVGEIFGKFGKDIKNRSNFLATTKKLQSQSNRYWYGIDKEKESQYQSNKNYREIFFKKNSIKIIDMYKVKEWIDSLESRV